MPERNFKATLKSFPQFHFDLPYFSEMFGYFSCHEFYMKYFIQVSLLLSLSRLCSSPYIFSSAQLYPSVSLWYRRDLILPPRVIVSQRSSFSPLASTGEWASEQATGTFVRCTPPTFFHRAVKLMTTPGAPARGRKTSQREEAEIVAIEDPRRGGEISQRNSTQSRRRKRKTEREWLEGEAEKQGHLANDAGNPSSVEHRRDCCVQHGTIKWTL